MTDQDAEIIRWQGLYDDLSWARDEMTADGFEVASERAAFDDDETYLLHQSMRDAAISVFQTTMLLMVTLGYVSDDQDPMSLP